MMLWTWRSAITLSILQSLALTFDVLGICGGGCVADEDADGIGDDVDSCIGVIDECGFAMSGVHAEITVDQIVTSYDSIYSTCH